MAITLALHAVEGSTYVVNAAFEDENGTATVPTAITWTLMDEAGAVVNDRENVVVTVPAASIDIVLSGDDLELDSYVGSKRSLTVEATYNSDLGAGLPLKAECLFPIDAIQGHP